MQLVAGDGVVAGAETAAVAVSAPAVRVARGGDEAAVGGAGLDAAVPIAALAARAVGVAVADDAAAGRGVAAPARAVRVGGALRVALAAAAVPVAAALLVGGARATGAVRAHEVVGAVGGRRAQALEVVVALAARAPARELEARVARGAARPRRPIAVAEAAAAVRLRAAAAPEHGLGETAVVVRGAHDRASVGTAHPAGAAVVVSGADRARAVDAPEPVRAPQRRATRQAEAHVAEQPARALRAVEALALDAAPAVASVPGGALRVVGARHACEVDANLASGARCGALALRHGATTRAADGAARALVVREALAAAPVAAHLAVGAVGGGRALGGHARARLAHVVSDAVFVAVAALLREASGRGGYDRAEGAELEDGGDEARGAVGHEARA